ncbi:unnamed protein product [Closterium sp. Naga37s-1]|nr:unnamed protein product [Closterium sp. Naga37s-1]
MAATSPIGGCQATLSFILRVVSRPDGQFQHALVCKKWYRIARRVQEHIQIRESSRMRPRELLAHLSSFPRLQKLVLAASSITSVPDSLLSGIADTCPDLTDLHVDTMKREYSRGGFTEHGLSYLFEKCTRLEGLHLDCQSNLTAIPSSIGGLASLKSLHITDRGRVALLPDAFTSLQALTHLVIEMPGLHELPQGFGNLRLLKSLQLNRCMGLSSIPDSFGQLTNLTHLFINGSAASLQLPESTSNLSSLLTLEISNCKDLAPLPESFGNLPALETLRLEEVGGITNLPVSLVHLQRLRLLSVINCCKLVSFPSPLSHLTSLTDLILVGQALDLLPLDVGLLPHLRALKLDGIRVHLPPSITFATALNELTLYDFRAIYSLPKEFGQLTALATLRLIELPRLSNLPASLGDLPSLKELKISECSQLAQLPDSLTLLSSLELLDISHCCKLTALPQGMGDGSTRLEVAGHAGCSSAAGSYGGSEEKDKSVLLPFLENNFWKLSSLKDLSLMSLPKLCSLPETFSQLPRLEGLTLLGCKRLARLPSGLQQMGKLEACIITDCRLLSKRQKMVICGTANLDEGERAVGGLEEEGEEEVGMGEEDEGSENMESEEEDGEGSEGEDGEGSERE